MSKLRDEILRRYASGQRSFQGEDLDTEVLDLKGACLAGADFSECFLFADFQGANLEGCRFERANVKTSDFRGANLRNASFLEAALCGTEFEGADLEGARFEGAYCYSHVFQAGEIPETLLTGPKPD